MSWTVTNVNPDVHVIPEEDLREHIAETCCWCCPSRDPECYDVLIHHSMDQRESYELGDRLPS